VQDKKRLNLYESTGVAVREMDTDTGPADYMLFVDGKACGINERKREGADVTQMLITSEIDPMHSKIWFQVRKTISIAIGLRASCYTIPRACVVGTPCLRSSSNSLKQDERNQGCGRGL
jgi:hypothetical protein